MTREQLTARRAELDAHYADCARQIDALTRTQLMIEGARQECDKWLRDWPAPQEEPA